MVTTVIQATDTAITRTGTTEHIRIMATIMGLHTTGLAAVDITTVTATTITTISTKLILAIE
jgi:hypothetical protein